jgi:putative hydrolase of the HAD superfamily
VPPLALFDLDNTLIDRAAAFRSWAAAFAAAHDLAATAVDVLERLDGDGLVPRERLFADVRKRFGLEEPVEDLVAAYRRDYPAHVQPPPPETLAALHELRERGWRLGIVTNGAPSQEAKIDVAGLADHVDGWAIPELVGARKPEPAIFVAAAAACGCALDGGWVVGDSAAADIVGAAACGLRSVWISRGRRWTTAEYAPDAVAAGVADAVARILRDDARTVTAPYNLQR